MPDSMVLQATFWRCQPCNTGPVSDVAKYFLSDVAAAAMSLFAAICSAESLALSAGTDA